MGYSRYGSTGKGLSDKGYARYVTKRAQAGKGTVIKNPLSYLVGMGKIGTPVTWANKPGYQGSIEQEFVKTGKTPVAEGRAPGGIRTNYSSGGAGGFGNAYTVKGRGGRGVGWKFGGKPMGLPPGEETGSGGILKLGALAFIVLKVLL